MIFGLTPADAGALIGGVGMAVLGYLKGQKRGALADTDPKTLAVAMAQPGGDPNQMRLMIEALNRLNDFASHALAALEDIEQAINRVDSGEGRVEAAVNRAEGAMNRVESAVRELHVNPGRLPRH